MLIDSFWVAGIDANALLPWDLFGAIEMNIGSLIGFACMDI